MGQRQAGLDAPAGAPVASGSFKDSPTPTPPLKGRGLDSIRTCILSREPGSREGLIRLALAPDGQVLPDIRAKAPGRGAWIGVDRATLDTAIAKGKLKGALSRAFKTGDIAIPNNLSAMIADRLQRDFLDRLGLESKAGKLLTGTAKIDAALRAGQVYLLLHAADARPDGAGKLAQAWRVGRDREGSGEGGLALPVPRTILSLALGRENVVHVAVTDPAAADRVRHALDRWRHFIGPDLTPEPCETASQGASALRAGVGTAEDDTKDFE